MLHDYFSLPGWAEGVASAGAAVTVLQRFHQSKTFTRNNVTYNFISDRWPGNLRTWHMPTAVRQNLTQLPSTKPTIIHSHGLVHPLQTRYLSRNLPLTWATLVQHHGELPWAGWRGHLQKWGLQLSDGFLFTHRQIAQPWLQLGIINHTQQIFSVMETSSLLIWADKTAARARTGLQGNPIFLWTGNLKANKDPLTILMGIAQLLQQHPQARLYMAFREDHLLAEVQQFLAAHPLLQQATSLLGHIPYDQINDYYNSADIFVQGSHKEAAGVALLDALACGVIPVVTDIPAFRTVTNNGTVGALWPVGNVTAFYESCQSILAQPLIPQAQQARQLFEQNWSFSAIGRQALQVYETVLTQKTAAHPHLTQPPFPSV